MVTWLARLVLVLLLVLSIWSIAVIWNRKKYFEQLAFEAEFQKIIAKKSVSEFQNHFQANPSIFSEAFANVLTNPVAQTSGQSSVHIEKLLNSFVLRKRTEWEQGLPILGTLGAISPFIGLLGTILGIIVAFGELSTGKMDSMKVMFALAEALVLTAVGLGVAIPAVIANNYFNRKITVLIRSLESLKEFVLGQRH